MALNSNQIVEELRQIISETIGADVSGVGDDVPLLDFVTSSLALVDSMRRVYERFGVLISIRRIMEGEANLGALALYIEQALIAQQKSQVDGPQSAHYEDDQKPKGERQRIPLAASQRHLAFLARYSSDAAAAYNEPVVLRLKGPLYGPALQAAIELVGERYEALRTALSQDDDQLEIISGEPVELLVSHVSLDDVDRRLDEIVRQPFEAGERLFRAELLRLSESDHFLTLVSHALVLDYEALVSLIKELSALYGTLSAGGDTAAAEKAMQWTEYLEPEERRDREQATVEARSYWSRTFADGIPLLELPLSRTRPAIKSYEGSRLVVEIDHDLYARVAGWARSLGSTPFDAWFAAYSVLLHRLSGQHEILIGAYVGQSSVVGLSPAVASRQNLMPIRSELRPGSTLSRHMLQLAAEASLATANAGLSLAELIQILDVPRDQSRSAIFTVAFGRRDTPPEPQFESLHTSFAPVPSSGSRYDIAVNIVSDDDRAFLVTDYSTQILDEATVSRWMNGILELMAFALDHVDEPCVSLPIMSARERHMLLETWNETKTPFPDHKTILDLVQEKMRQNPDKTAIACGADQMSYAELGARAEKIALSLKRSGVEPGDRVGILLPRTPDLVASMLAVWQVGTLYVPLDLMFPKKRLVYMMNDSRVHTVITCRQLMPLVEEQAVASLLAIEAIDENSPIQGDLSNPPGPSDSAYLIYTSGSTGQPKGVEIGHAGLTNLVISARDLLNFTPADSFFAITTISFDISLLEILVPLAAGGTLDLAPDGLAADGIGLVQSFETRRPSFVQATPSTWKAVLAAGWGGDPETNLISAGESLDRDLAEKLILRGRTLWNLYGPTEATVYASAYQVSSDPDMPMRIGRPLPNYQSYILDEYLQPVPVGVVGELYIGGVGIAKGYWQRAALSSERFVENPFTEGTRLYRTGDLARFLSNGEVECLGRLDFQVKVHGVRVELGEVEAALRDLVGIADAVVTPSLDPHGNARLVAHLKAGSEAESMAAAEIRSRLRERLPEVMIPTHYMFLDEFPTTANGKINRAVLPAVIQEPEANSGTTSLPATPTERLLAQAWSTVLQIDLGSIGRDQDFMDLGGHSLLMTPLLIDVRKLFHVHFSLREFFGAPTIRTFGAMIDERRKSRSANANGSNGSGPLRNSEWGRERMAFLKRETQLPPAITPARGLSYRHPSKVKVALMTGATGFIGAYIVSEILKTTDVHLYCLVRPRREEEGKSRVKEKMQQYAVWQEDEQWQSAWRQRVHVVEGDVTLPRLGLPDESYESLARQVDCIIHSAAHVNFIYPYEALRATNVLGLHEIIRFAFHARIKPVHHMSTAAIWPMGAEYTFYEKDSIDHGILLNLGYDEAKWVGEGCLLTAADRGLPVARYRPGEVGGDSKTGRCVLDHFLFAAAKGFLQLGAFPALDMFLDVTPADYVAKAFVYLVFQGNSLGRAFHLTNPNRCHMSEALTFLRSLGYRFEELPFQLLRQRLINDREYANNALFPYQSTLEDMDDRSLQLPNYDCSQTLRELSGSGIVCPAVDAELLGTYVRYLRSVEFFPEPTEQAVLERF